MDWEHVLNAMLKELDFWEAGANFCARPCFRSEGAAGTKKDKNSYSHGASILVISGDFFF